MANQPGYVAPGQNNASNPSGGSGYFKNAFETSGQFGPGFQSGGNQGVGFGFQGNRSPMAGQGNLLGGQNAMPQSVSGGQGYTPGAQQSGALAAADANLPSGNTGGGDMNAPVSAVGDGATFKSTPATIPASQSGSQAVGYYEGTGYDRAGILFADGTIQYYQSGKHMDPSVLAQLSNYGIGKAVTLQSLEMAVPQLLVNASEVAQDPYQDSLRFQQSLDTEAIAAQQLSQNAALLEAERGRAVQNRQRQMGSMGFGASSGLDSGGIGLRYAGQGAQMAIDSADAQRIAEQNRLAEITNLENQAGAFYTGNSEAVEGQFQSLVQGLQSHLETLAWKGDNIMVNTGMSQELHQAMIHIRARGISAADARTILDGITGRYGNTAFVNNEGKGIGAWGGSFAQTAPESAALQSTY